MKIQKAIAILLVFVACLYKIMQIQNVHSSQKNIASVTAAMKSTTVSFEKASLLLITNQPVQQFTILTETNAVIIILLLTTIITIYYIRSFYLKKRKTELEKLVETKITELQKINAQLSDKIDELKLSEEELRQSNYLKDEYFAVLTHDLRSPLRFLSFNICQLIDMMPDTNTADFKKGLAVACECTNDVAKLIDDFVYWIRNNENQLQAQPVNTMINPMVEDIKKLYGFTMEGNKNQLITDVSPDLQFITDPQMFFIMLRNAVDNANKYTSEGTVTVTVVKKENDLHITVADTGTGMNKELIKELTQLQYDESPFGHKQRKSLGFYIMAMLTRKLNGCYTISSVTGMGTILHFIIPGPGTETN